MGKRSATERPQTNALTSPSDAEGDKTQSNFHNPVDRGWAWVILFSLVFIQMICIGFIKSFGVLFVGIQQKFGASASMVSLIAGVQSGTFSLFALVTLSFLIDLMSVRTLVMLGGFIASVGIALSFFAGSVYFLVGSQAVCVGVGFSMIFGPGFVLLSSYFVKRRPLAAAVGNSGGSLGALIMPYLTRLFLDDFGLSGTYLLLAGIFAQIMVLASFYTAPSDYKLNTLYQADIDTVNRTGVKSVKESGDAEDDDVAVSLLGAFEKGNTLEVRGGCNGVDKSGGSVVHCGNGHIQTSNDTVQTDSGVAQSDTATLYSDSAALDESGVSENQNEHIYPSEEIPHGASLHAIPSHVISQSYDDRSDFSPFSRPRAFSDPYSKSLEILAKSQPNSRPKLYKQQDGVRIEIGIHVSASSLRSRKHSFSSQISKKLQPYNWNNESLSALNCDALHFGSKEVVAQVEGVEEISVSDEAKQSSNKCVQCFKSLDTSLYRKPLFWLILFYNFFGMVGVGIPLTLLPPFALEKGLTVTDGAMLVMISGALDIVGRLLPGFIAQLKILRPQTMLILAFLVEGIIFQFTSLLNTLPALVILAVLHGLCAGVFPSMMQLVIIDFVGLHHFPRAFGFAQLTIGIGGAIFFPILGYLRDRSGTFVVSFHVVGVCMLLAFALLLMEPLARRLQDRLSESDQQHRDQESVA